MPGVDAIGRRVLAYDQQFLGPRRHQLFGLAQHCVDPPRHQVAPDRGNDAEGTAMVAAFGNLEIAVMARRQFEAAFRDQVDKGVGNWRRCVMHRVDDLLILMRAGDGQYLRKTSTDHLRFVAHTSRHDDPTVFRDRLANGFQRFLLGRIEKAAGVDQHDVGAGIVGGHLIAVRAQFREDAFAIDQRLGTAERNHADFRRVRKFGCHDRRAHRDFRAQCHALRLHNGFMACGGHCLRQFR